MNVKQERIFGHSGDCTDRHHVEPRIKLYVPLAASFPIPLKFIDVTRATSTLLDVMLEKILTIIGTLMGTETLQRRGQALLGSRYWIFKPPDGPTRSGERLTRKQTTSRPDSLWPEIWNDMSEASTRKAKQKWSIEKPKLVNARKLRGIYFTDPAEEEFKETEKCDEKVGSCDASSNALQDQKTRVQGDL